MKIVVGFQNEMSKTTNLVIMSKRFFSIVLLHALPINSDTSIYELQICQLKIDILWFTAFWAENNYHFRDHSLKEKNFEWGIRKRISFQKEFTIINFRKKI
jgi:hypothetical protein